MSAAPKATCNVVVGGNRGIGLEVVRRLLENLRPSASPHTVVMTARDKAQGETACKEVRGQGQAQDQLRLECLALDVTKAESIDSFDKELGDVSKGASSINLIHNAGFAFSTTSSEPFGQQAEVTCGINYFGVVALVRKVLPRLQATEASSRIVYVSSMAGESAYSSLSAPLKARLDQIVATGTEAELDDFVKDFVAAAKEGKHKEKGYPGSSYGMSKCVITAHARLLDRQLNRGEQGLVLPVVSCCPGFCRTGMTLKNPWSPTSWAFFVASYMVGQSAYAGADTPVWLALEADPKTVSGRHVSARQVKS